MGVHLASPAPACCAACYAQNPQARHVDFEAASDGPIIVDEDGSVRTWPYGTVSVEEVILCESCVRAGAELLALEPAEMERLAQELRDARQETATWRARAEAAQAALSLWGQPPEPEPEPEKPRKVPVIHTAETKREAVERVHAGEKISAVARELDVTATTVSNWLKDAEPAAVA